VKLCWSETRNALSDFAFAPIRISACGIRQCGGGHSVAPSNAAYKRRICQHFNATCSGSRSARDAIFWTALSTLQSAIMGSYLRAVKSTPTCAARSQPELSPPCLDQRFGFGCAPLFSRDMSQFGKICSMGYAEKASLCRRLSRRVNMMASKHPVTAPKNASVIERLLKVRSPWPVRMNPVYAIATVQRITRTGYIGDHLLPQNQLKEQEENRCVIDKEIGGNGIHARRHIRICHHDASVAASVEGRYS
jgi:hypothetical protein